MKSVERLMAVLIAVCAFSGCAAALREVVPVGSGRIYCVPLDYEDMRRTAEQKRPPGSMTVPLVIHAMDRHDDVKRTVLSHWAADHAEVDTGPVVDRIKTYFGPGPLGVNEIWRQAGIHFEVRRVQWCRYEKPPNTETEIYWARPPDPGPMREETLAKQRARIDTYLGWNQLYGVRRAINVYLWQNILDANGYGESPRRARAEADEAGVEALATVWMESGIEECNDVEPLCQLMIAHELGHALGLKHVCRTCATKRCCDDLCWESPSSYFYCDVNKALECRPQLVRESGDDDPECCCGCGRADEVLDGLNVCGEATVCCSAYPGKNRLMFDDVTGEGKSGEGKSGPKLCEGEIHSARAAAREFLAVAEGDNDGQEGRNQPGR